MLGVCCAPLTPMCPCAITLFWLASIRAAWPIGFCRCRSFMTRPLPRPLALVVLYQYWYAQAQEPCGISPRLISSPSPYVPLKVQPSTIRLRRVEFVDHATQDA